MAKKKTQDDVPNPNSIQNRDIMQRLNFLYQASVLLGTSTQPVPQHESTTDSTKAQTKSRQTQPKSRRKRKQEMLEQRNPSTAIDLSRTYVRSMKVIGRKTTVRMDPTVKRTLCKNCELVLVPGSTATVRINASGPHSHVISYTCMSCRTSRRIPAPAEPVTHEDPKESPTSAEERNEEAMNVDTGAVPRVSRRKKAVTRQPPLFARKDAGHIVFRGNERLEPQ